ncbi:MAG: glycyl-radical enzyme activating protein [Bacteroidetes bacterium]|nr:glycyl-radical enzyme activating protein [Bacteroidota bacterium]
MIFNIQRFSTHDGDGIRTVIFYKGCPLRCQWCSNPESQSFGYSVMYDKKKCNNFGDCIKAHNKAITRIINNGIQINRELINENEPEKLKNICASKALTISGESKSVDELLNEIEKDTLFYRDNGGVTLSGGEPLSQGDELKTLLQKLKGRNINVNIETSLHVNWSEVARCIGLVETFLIDLKHIDKDKLKSFTQGDAELVINNINKLTDSDAHVIVRIAVIPGFNHSEDEMKQMIEFVISLKNVNEIHFLPYHTYGVEKYKMLGIDYIFDHKKQVQDSELEPYIRYAQSKGLRTKIGG